MKHVNEATLVSDKIPPDKMPKTDANENLKKNQTVRVFDLDLNDLVLSVSIVC